MTGQNWSENRTPRSLYHFLAGGGLGLLGATSEARDAVTAAMVHLGDVDESIYSAKERMKESANTEADPSMSH